MSRVISIGRGVLFLLLLLATTAHAAQEAAYPRYALVIGNRSYAKSPVRPAHNDANEMADALTLLGFKVEKHLDLTRDGMLKEIEAFRERLSGGGTALFYFSGHGLQFSGKNYLIPKDADLGSFEDIANKMVAHDSVLGAMANSGPNIVILDACRDAALPSSITSSPGWSKGFTDGQDAPANTLIAYSSSPGYTTPSSNSELSPYTDSLLKHLRTPGMRLSELFVQVRLSMAYNAKRVTWETGSHDSDYLLSPATRATFLIQEANDDVMILVNGRVIATAQQHGFEPIDVEMVPGRNEVTIMVYNQRTKRGGASAWGGKRAEGWSYKVLVTSAGRPLASLHDAEETPVRDGPHHGKLFTVAHVTLYVGPIPAELKVEKIDDKVWKEVPGTHFDALYASQAWSAQAPRLGQNGATPPLSNLNIRLSLPESVPQDETKLQAYLKGRKDVWERLGTPLDVARGLLWFNLNVEKVLYGPARREGSAAWVPLTLQCRPTFHMSPKSPVASATLPPIQSGEVELGPSLFRVHAELDLLFLEALLDEEMQDQPFLFDEGYESTVDEVSLEEMENRVRLVVKLRGPITGKAFLTGRLGFDSSSQSLVLDDAEVSFEGSPMPPPNVLAVLRRRLATEPLWRMETDLGYARRKLADILSRVLGPGARISVGSAEPQSAEVKSGRAHFVGAAAVDSESLLP